MHELKIFENEEFGQIRTTLDENGNVLFCGSDVAKALGYMDAPKAIKLHCKKDGWAIYPVIDSIGRTQQAKFLNEGNVYRLIIKSKLPSAERFEKWVFEEVLPSIRKYGAYVIAPKLEEIIANPESLELLLKQLLTEMQKNNELEQRLTELVPKGTYYDKLIETEMLTNFRTTANELGIKPMAFTQFLIDNKYVYRDTRQKVLPYQPYIHDGLFVIKDFCKNGYHGQQTLITVYGKLYLLEELQKEKRI
ncbi:BRO family protein [Niameybacter massiliensis]|uniref:BRO family protein n=1 Tax=Holtiella tumoricola TaxID=3018743 RepID=A0AA42DMD6_9FIRM|nr:BRO family protein [Holtiella tumoricola]MDA3731411.1 BRO family protein [Holtiella tumoricola]